MTPMEAEARRKYDRSHITDEERRAIDAAIQAGRIQRIPRGVSGYTHEDVVWCEKINRLRSVDPEAAKRAYAQKSNFRKGAPKGNTNAAAANAARAAEREAAIARAAELSRSGLSIAKIAATMGVTMNAARTYVRAAGIVHVPERSAEKAARVAKAKAMRAAGENITTIARAIGRSRKRTREYLREGEPS